MLVQFRQHLLVATNINKEIGSVLPMVLANGSACSFPWPDLFFSADFYVCTKVSSVPETRNYGYFLPLPRAVPASAAE